MKKSLIFFVALPLVFAGIGYGAGIFLAPSEMAADSETMTPVMDENETEHSGPETYASFTKPPKPENLEIVRIGRIMVPVYKPDTIAYVIADLSLAVDGVEKAEFLDSMEGITRVRNLILATLTDAAQTSLMTGDTVNPDLAAIVIEQALREEFPEVYEVKFLSLTTNDRPRT